jgi:hypothetical protein
MAGVDVNVSVTMTTMTVPADVHVWHVTVMMTTMIALAGVHVHVMTMMTMKRNGQHVGHNAHSHVLVHAVGSGED